LRWVFAYATKVLSSEIHIWLVEASEVELHSEYCAYYIRSWINSIYLIKSVYYLIIAGIRERYDRGDE